MISEEKRLEAINDTLNPDPPRFGMPWYTILGILTFSVLVFMVPGCKIFGLLLCPAALGYGWWLTKDDPREPMLIIHDLILPTEYDPAK